MYTAKAIEEKHITLNSDQQRGFDTIVKFVESEGTKTLVLKGYAGTGKSTLIQTVASYFHGVRSFCFTAPTNKATKVLSEMSQQQNTGVKHISTIHKLLGLRMTPDGSIKVLSRSMQSFEEIPFDVVVIDECSMIGPELFLHIEEVLENNPHLKIIYMGDPMQLPPIGEELSATFQTAQVKVELTEVVRQAADNPIIQLCHDIRESILHGKTIYNLKTSLGTDKKSGIHVLPEKAFKEWTRAGYASEAYKENANSFKTVAWRNVTVDASNRLIRRAIYPADSKGRLPKYMLEERVVVASPVTDLYGDEILASTDSEGTVVSCHTIDAHPWLEAYGDFKVYDLVVDFIGIGAVQCYVLHEDAYKTYNKKLSQMSAEAKKKPSMWGTFWNFKDSFHDLRYAHAVTSHRSQGSTYENVFVHHQDIMFNRNKKEAYKSFYVAASRASKNLMILE